MLSRRTIVTAALLFALEAFVFQTFVLTFLVAAGVTMAALIKLLRRDDWPPTARSAALYWMVFAYAAGAISVNNRISRERTLRIANAIRQYKETRGHYPDALKDLVPAFLPSIPVARYTLMLNEFHYSSSPDHAHLIYVQLPPFGRPYFRVENGTWGYLD